MAKVKSTPRSGAPFGRSKVQSGFPKLFFLITIGLVLCGGLYAQTEYDYPAGSFWTLGGGLGWTGLMEEGQSFQLLIDPKLWISPELMVGVRAGVSYSFEALYDDPKATSDTLMLEAQANIRWNFLRLGDEVNRKVNIFAQAGIGLVGAYRGVAHPFDTPTATRGSILLDGTLGVTIPLTDQWYIEPQVRGGFPFMYGVILTAGFKFPLPTKTTTEVRTEYVEVEGETRVEYVEVPSDPVVEYVEVPADPVIEYVEVPSDPVIEYVEVPSDPVIEYRDVIRVLPPIEIVKMLSIQSVEFVIFGPDIAAYNLGVDQNGQSLNDLVLSSTADLLIKNPDYIVRLEGNANPVTTDPNEAEELMTLSQYRANTVADELEERGVPQEQMLIVAFGGTRTVTSERERWDMNRRVEIIIMNANADTTESAR